VLVRPLITEKNTLLMEQGKYIFEIDRSATKDQVKEAVETIFSVTVAKVHTVSVRGKMRRRGREFGYTKDWKKAIVTLVEGDRIELFEN
jgi:large subunit ribosomal protein L23